MKWRNGSFTIPSARNYCRHHVRHTTPSPSATSKSHQSLETSPSERSLIVGFSISGSSFGGTVWANVLFINTFHGVRLLVPSFLKSWSNYCSWVRLDSCFSNVVTALSNYYLWRFGTLAVSPNLKSQFFFARCRNLRSIQLDGALLTIRYSSHVSIVYGQGLDTMLFLPSSWQPSLWYRHSWGRTC